MNLFRSDQSLFNFDFEFGTYYEICKIGVLSFSLSFILIHLLVHFLCLFDVWWIKDDFTINGRKGTKIVYF